MIDSSCKNLDGNESNNEEKDKVQEINESMPQYVDQMGQTLDEIEELEAMLEKAKTNSDG
jgi:hypothetical protein